MNFFKKLRIKFSVWARTRGIKDREEATFQITVDGDEPYDIETTGDVLRAIVYVEEVLKADKRWTLDHLFAFYNAVIDMDEFDDLTASHVYMCLSPENYFSEEEYEVEI